VVDLIMIFAVANAAICSVDIGIRSVNQNKRTERHVSQTNPVAVLAPKILATIWPARSACLYDRRSDEKLLPGKLRTWAAWTGTGLVARAQNSR